MSDRPLFSICHTTARPDQWEKSYRTYIKRAVEPDDVEYVLCTDARWGFKRQAALTAEWQKGDPAIHLECWEMKRDGMNTLVWNDGRKCMVDGYATAVAASTGSIIILGSDDITPPDEWDVRLGELIPDTSKDLAVHVSTGYYDGLMASGIQILSRTRLERYGYALHPEFESMYSDDDFLEQAYHDQVVIDGRHLMFPHNHPAAAGEWDEVYRHQNSAQSYEVGAHVLMARRILRHTPANLPTLVDHTEAPRV